MSNRLPVIVGFGGVCPAGRSSSSHAYKRIIIDHLSSDEQADTLLNLALMMGLVHFEKGECLDRNNQSLARKDLNSVLGEFINQNTLIRKMELEHFDCDKVSVHKAIHAKTDPDKAVQIRMSKRDLPISLPANWKLQDDPLKPEDVIVEIKGDFEFLFPDQKKQLASSAGQLPTGFNPGDHYSSKNHPRGLQMTVFGVSDALSSMGMELDDVIQFVRPEQIGVYASSSMGLLDDFALGGYMKGPLLGRRTSSKQMPFSFAEMPADFINAYVLGSVGHTCGIVGACSSFLYNLQSAVRDIQSGVRRIAIVGGSEAPLLPEVFEGYRVMSALAEDQQILELDKGKGITYVDHKRACRPFGYNCGFTMSESAQFMILFDEELTLERGAEIMGSVPAVFVHADGIKKSITSPGVGNFITMARAASVLDKILGEKGLQERSFVHAHGTGTPQNRVTESQVINMTAENFKINKWPVGAIKCYLGHPIGTAGGDQIMAALGTWRYGVIPGIFTLDEIADDVVSDRLLLSQNHLEYSKEHFEASLVNTKGFGGNNATGVILSPEKTKELIRHKAGEKSFSTYQKKNEKIKKTAEEKEQEKMRGEYNLIYRFGEKVIEGEDLRFEENRIHVKGFKNPVDLD